MSLFDLISAGKENAFNVCDRESNSGMTFMRVYSASKSSWTKERDREICIQYIYNRKHNRKEKGEIAVRR